MKKLRLLILNSFLVNHDFTAIAYLSNELRILKWDRFPFTSLPSSFQPDRLVELTLQRSNIKLLWNSPIKPLYNLKIIDLSFSKKFSKFEDFKVVPNLEKLILKHCSGLVEIHSSITLLKRLTLLNLNHCDGLENLPTSIKGLKSLKVLKLSNCISLRNLPEDLGHLNSLEELHLDDTSVRDLPPSIVFLKNLKIRARFLEPQQLKNMLNIIVGKGLISGCLSSLKKLDLSSCSLGDGAIPEDFGCLASLEELDLRNNYISCLPTCISQLSKLRILDLRCCENLKSLRLELPTSLEMVWVDNCTLLETFLDPSNDQCNLRCSASCLGCFKLVGRQGSKMTAFASLKRYLQNPPNPSKRFEIVLPGNEIPAWFTHRSLGKSISLQLDPNWCSSKWMGFAFSVFTHTSFSCKFNVRTDGHDLGFGLVQSPTFFYDWCDHLWLIYIPRDICFHTKWQNNCSQIEFAVGSISYGNESYKNNEYGCGVRLVYEQDLQDLNLHREDEDKDFGYLSQKQGLTRVRRCFSLFSECNRQRLH